MLGKVWPAFPCCASHPHPEDHSLPQLKWKCRFAEGKSRLQIIPRPNCNWATYSQTGNPGEGSGSTEILLTKVVRKRCWESYKNKQQKDAHKQSRGHRWIPQKVSFPLLSLPVERIPYIFDKRRGQRMWTFSKTLLKSSNMILLQFTNCD